MNNKKDFSSALRTTTTQQKSVIEDRFARADSALLNPTVTSEPAQKAELAGPPSLKELVTRDTFSMPSDEHAIIERLRVAAAKENVLVNKSEIVRCALSLLATIDSEELLKRLSLLKKGRPGRK